MSDRRIPWWLWPNVLSLDAPLVAVSWLWMFARHWNVDHVGLAFPWLLAGMVWIIYVVDRWHDAKSRHPMELGERHDFHHRHGKCMLAIAVLLFAISIVILFTAVPLAILWHPPPHTGPAGQQYTHPSLADLIDAARTHGALVLGGVAAFFLLARISATQSPTARIVKNSVAAFTFACGTAIGAHFHTALPVSAMATSPAVLAFAALCLINLNAIDLWEFGKKSGTPTRRMSPALFFPLLMLAVASFFLITLGHAHNQWEFPIALWAAASALIILDHFQARLSAPLLRVLADVALLLPLPVLLLIP